MNGNSLGLVLWLLGASACGASRLPARFAQPEAVTEAMVAESVSRAALRDDRPVVVGITQKPVRLAAWELSGQLLWERPVDAKSAPLVVGDAVVLQELDGIVVRDLGTGEARVTLRERAGSLVGADAMADRVVVSVAYPEGSTRGMVALIEGSSVRWRKAFPQPVGVPALTGDEVLVPWGTQRLTVLSAQDASELARWHFRNMVLGQALVDRGQVYVGQQGLLRVSPELPDRRDGPVVLLAPLKRPLPGQPALLRDGYAAVAPPGGAEHRVGLSWRPAATQKESVEDALLSFRYYGMLFGLSAQADEVKWVRHFDTDLVGTTKHPGGWLVADAQGCVRFVDVHGSTRLLKEFGRPLQVAALRPGASWAAPTGEPALEAPQGSLHDQLLAAVTLDDARLAPARALAVQYLARTDAPSVTRELIGLCAPTGASRGPTELAACDELAKRETGAVDVLEALRERASWLEGTSRPPVAALAQAAARMRLQKAGPLLLNHAEDPHTPAAALEQVFLALSALEYRPAVPQLERFVRLHHAEAEGSDLAPALQAALLALGSLHGQKARDTVAYIADDSFTLPAVRKTASEVLGALNAPEKLPAQAKAGPENGAKVAKEVVIEEAVLTLTDPRPYALGPESVQKAFRPLHGALVQCLEADPSAPSSMRIAMIVAGEGHVEGFLVTPTTLQGCAEPILRNARFPETRLGRQHLVHTVRRGKARPSP